MSSFDPQTRRLYSYGAIRLSNIKMQYSGALVETKAYKDWLGALPPKEHGEHFRVCFK